MFDSYYYFLVLGSWIALVRGVSSSGDKLDKRWGSAVQLAERSALLYGNGVYGMELVAVYMTECIVREKKVGVSRCCWRRGGGRLLNCNVCTCPGRVSPAGVSLSNAADPSIEVVFWLVSEYGNIVRLTYGARDGYKQSLNRLFPRY